jgi:type IV pilus assembly protein PilA
LKTKLENRRRRGFTLIELLVVILILSILMAVALPLYVGSLTDSQVKTCRSNMWSIAQAEQAYKTRVAGHTYTTSISNLAPDLGAATACPASGSYSVAVSTGTDTANNGIVVPTGGIIVKCDAAAHGVFAPGIDSR